MQHDALVRGRDKLLDPTGKWDLIKRSFLEEDSSTYFPKMGEEMIENVALILRIKIGCYSVIGSFILSLNINSKLIKYVKFFTWRAASEILPCRLESRPLCKSTRYTWRLKFGDNWSSGIRPFLEFELDACWKETNEVLTKCFEKFKNCLNLLEFFFRILNLLAFFFLFLNKKIILYMYHRNA